MKLVDIMKDKNFCKEFVVEHGKLKCKFYLSDVGVMYDKNGTRLEEVFDLWDLVNNVRFTPVEGRQ